MGKDVKHREKLATEAADLVAHLHEIAPRDADNVVADLRRRVALAARRPGGDELERHRAAAIAELEQNPHQATRCAAERARKEWGHRLTCRQLPSVAVAIRGVSGTTYYRFQCAAHARRSEREGAAVVPLARERFVEARRKVESL